MKLVIKTLPLIILSTIISLYFSGCSSTEQTTARLAYAQGDFAKAEREFLKETQQNPANEEAWFYLALSRVQLQKVDGVDEAMQQYRKIGKNTFQSDLINTWGQIYDAGYKNFSDASKQKDTAFSMKLYKSAINDFKMALALVPDSIFVQKNIDVINSKISSISIKPILDHGVEMEGKGDYEGAINEYKRALTLAPKGNANYEIVAYNLGIGYLKWGETQRNANPDDQSYKDKYQLGLPFLEDLTQSKDQQTQLQAWDLLVSVYGNLNMQDKALDAIKNRDELKAKLNNK